MTRGIPAVLLAALLLAPACTKTTETTATTTPPVSSATTDPTPSRSPSGTRAATGTSVGSEGLGRWTAQNADGPLSDAILEGGHILCSFNSKGTLWDMQSKDNEAPYGTIDLIFKGDTDQADVEITTPGGKGDLAKGSATVSRTPGSGDVLSFSIGASYRMENEDATGTFQASGACLQEKPRR